MEYFGGIVSCMYVVKIFYTLNGKNMLPYVLTLLFSIWNVLLFAILLFFLSNHIWIYFNILTHTESSGEGCSVLIEMYNLILSLKNLSNHNKRCFLFHCWCISCWDISHFVWMHLSHANATNLHPNIPSLHFFHHSIDRVVERPNGSF